MKCLGWAVVLLLFSNNATFRPRSIKLPSRVACQNPEHILLSDYRYTCVRELFFVRGEAEEVGRVIKKGVQGCIWLKFHRDTPEVGKHE